MYDFAEFQNFNSEYGYNENADFLIRATGVREEAALYSFIHTRTRPLQTH